MAELERMSDAEFIEYVTKLEPPHATVVMLRRLLEVDRQQLEEIKKVEDHLNVLTARVQDWARVNYKFERSLDDAALEFPPAKGSKA